MMIDQIWVYTLFTDPNQLKIQIRKYLKILAALFLFQEACESVWSQESIKDVFAEITKNIMQVPLPLAIEDYKQ